MSATCSDYTEATAGQHFSRSSKIEMELTPFMIGISEAGSVDMDASSMNTTGKSMIFNAWQAAVMHVVQIYIS
jgi:hypothetical protein